MTLMDTLEALSVAYNRGGISLQYAACIVNANTIQELIELSLYFNIEFVGTNPIKRERLQELEKEYSGWKLSSVRVLE